MILSFKVNIRLQEKKNNPPPPSFKTVTYSKMEGALWFGTVLLPQGLDVKLSLTGKFIPKFQEIF